MKDFTLELTDAEKQEIYVWVDQFKLSSLNRQTQTEHRQRLCRCSSGSRNSQDILPETGRAA